MTTLREKAQNISTEERTTIKNVADLVTINIDTVIEKRVFAQGTEKEFTVEGFELNGVFYRVPFSVQKQIKLLLEEIPDLQLVKIKKSGTGLETTYMVLPV